MAERMPALSDALLEVFGASSWVFLPAMPARELAAELGADILDEQFSWGENPHLGEGGPVLVLTASIDGWMLLQGASETVGGAAAVLSERRDLYRATIDVRLPVMSWAFLQGGMPTRTVSLELGDDGSLVAVTAGDPLPFEADGLPPPAAEHALDSFFYPMAILAGHGATPSELERALDRPSVTVRIV